MKRSRKSRSINKSSLSNRPTEHRVNQDVGSKKIVSSAFLDGVYSGFASPYIFLFGSDLSLAKHPISGTAEAWYDVGYNIRASANSYDQTQKRKKRDIPAN
jgi:hypothetical protein